MWSVAATSWRVLPRSSSSSAVARLNLRAESVPAESNCSSVARSSSRSVIWCLFMCTVYQAHQEMSVYFSNRVLMYLSYFLGCWLIGRYGPGSPSPVVEFPDAAVMETATSERGPGAVVGQGVGASGLRLRAGQSAG